MTGTPYFVSMFESLLVACLFVAAAGCASLQPPSAVEQVSVDFSQIAGRIRAIHGVNGGPISNGENPDLRPWFRQAGFPAVRLHDSRWPSPDVVDIHTIFPLAHLDADDPRNYTFAKTDDYIKGIIDTGAKVVFRLGESIETHGTQYHINPPEDMDKFARVCVNIMRHYNEGWANGLHYGIEYWEVWNEPENRWMWTGTKEQYFTLYEKVARALKSQDPNIKVGGPSFANPNDRPDGWARSFLAHCRNRHVPLDFFSFHCYLGDVVNRCRFVRKLLDEYGFSKTESHLNEFRYVRSWKGRHPDDPADFVNVPAWMALGTNSVGASYAVSALIRLQDEPVDMTNYYSADTSVWGMFGPFGLRTPVFHGYRAFQELVKRPRRAVMTVTGNAKAPSQVLAGLAENNQSAAVVLSTFRSEPGTRTITLRGLPWNGASRVESLMVDETHALEPLPARIGSDAAGATTVTVDLAPDVICLIRIAPSATARPEDASQ